MLPPTTFEPSKKKKPKIPYQELKHIKWYILRVLRNTNEGRRSHNTQIGPHLIPSQYRHISRGCWHFRESKHQKQEQCHIVLYYIMLKIRYSFDVMKKLKSSTKTSQRHSSIETKANGHCWRLQCHNWKQRRSRSG